MIKKHFVEFDDTVESIVLIPKIEMTKKQKEEIDNAKNKLETSDLANVISLGIDGYDGYSILDELSGRIWGHNQGEANNVELKKTMIAWLFPQVIKVVD